MFLSEEHSHDFSKIPTGAIENMHFIFSKAPKFGAFEKMKCIFSIAPVGILEKSWECYSLRNTHRTLAVEAPNAEALRPVCCGARVKHRTVLTGQWVTPVHTSGAL